MRAIRLFGLTAAVGAVLALPAPSFGVVTIGSNLGRAPDGPPGCLSGTCTYAISTSFPVGNAVPDGVTSPVNGTVTTWRIRAGASTTATSFRVIRSLGSGLFTGAGTSAAVTPPIDTTTPFSTQLPIRIGDLIGIDCVSPCGVHFRDAGGIRLGWSSPSLVDGGPGRVATKADSETLINADIEPTSTLASVKARTKKRGKVKVAMETPNAGSLVAGDKRDPSVKAAAAAKKPKLLKRTTAQAGAPGPLSVVIKPTKAAKSALADGRRPKAKLKLVFTPTGGGPFTQVVPVKLRR